MIIVADKNDGNSVGDLYSMVNKSNHKESDFFSDKEQWDPPGSSNDLQRKGSWCGNNN